MCSFLFTNQKDFKLDDVNFLLKKRGPDYTGVQDENGFTYIHNLLSITGEFFIQPIVTNSFNVLFNGEIYNYNEFGNFRSDSECITKLYEEEGIGGLLKIDGEFSIFIHDKINENFLLLTDTFGTKPLYWAVEGDKIGVSSYPDPLKILGFKEPIRCNPNTILTIDSKKLDVVSENEIFQFDLEQKKETYSDWKKAFRRSIEKRTSGIKHNLLLPLSSGYDSGLIACILNDLSVDYTSYSIIGSENNNILNSRISVNKNKNKEIIPFITGEKISEISKLFDENLQHFSYGPNPLEITHDGFKDPGAIGLYYILSESIGKYNTKIVLSGQGADEIMSNIQTYGFKTKNPERFGDNLKEVFPWGNFYMGSQWSYLMKEECIAGSLGIETRYPFLDRELVQEYLWLKPELKNKEYKAPIKDYLEDFSYPYHNNKIGFNIGQ
jgi:asparagine synthetase B (glutamine-hydrolysing)